MHLALALAAIMAGAGIQQLPSVLAIPVDAVSDDLVVSSPEPEPQVIVDAIQSHDVDYSAATNGLLTAAKPGAEVGAVKDQIIAGELANPR